MKLVIEGMDGVGKTTVAKKIAEKYNIKYVDGLMNTFFRDEGFSEEEIKVLNKAIEKFYNYNNSIIRTWIMGFANLFNLMNYKDDVIIDRHCITTFFYNGDKKSCRIYKIMQYLSGKPDLVIILVANPKERVKRIKHRNITDKDLSESIKLSYGYDKFIEIAKYLNLNYVTIQTDNLSLDEVIGKVSIYVEKYLKNGD